MAGLLTHVLNVRIGVSIIEFINCFCTHLSEVGLPDFDVALELELTKQCDPGEAIQEGFDKGLSASETSGGEPEPLPLKRLGCASRGEAEEGGGCWGSSTGAQI